MQQFLKDKDGTFEWMKEDDYKDDAEFVCFKIVSQELIDRREFWMAYKILKLLLKYDKDEREIIQYHRALGQLLGHWSRDDSLLS